MLNKLHLPNWLVGILALVLILRIPSFFEPYYYGDEMIYLTLGQGIRQGVALYSGIYDNKPPLLYLAATVAGNLFWFKAILTFWSMAAIIAFWKLTKSKIASFIFALLITLPLLEGNTVNAEPFLIGLNILAFFFLLTQKLSVRNLILAGSFFGLATLFKVPAAFDIPAIILYWLITQGLKNWRKIVKNTLYLTIGFLIPIFFTFGWFLIGGSLIDYVKAAFLQNIGYVSSWEIKIPFIARVGATAVFVSLLALVRRKISKEFLFACLWLTFSLFAVTLSQRPYPHYLIQSAAPIAILLAMLFIKKNKEQVLVIIPLTIALFIPVYYKFYHYDTFAYYQRFINFAVGKIDKDSYFASFSPDVKRNYEIADFLTKSSFPAERVFVWDTDSPTIYALARRLPPVKFVADYHVNDYFSRAGLAEELNNNTPGFIILTSDHPFPEIMDLIHKEYILIAQIENADIYSKLGKTTP